MQPDPNCCRNITVAEMVLHNAGMRILDKTELLDDLSILRDDGDCQVCQICSDSGSTTRQKLTHDIFS